MHEIEEARACLRDVTPMKTDCGALCGGACCLSEENDGMVLLPGEEIYYRNADWCELRRIGDRNVLVCRGSCPREDRPFACRIFPLYLKFTGEKPALAVDPLSLAVCPLAEQGLRGLNRAFSEAAKSACRILLRDEALTVHLKKESALRDHAFDHPLFQSLPE